MVADRVCGNNREVRRIRSTNESQTAYHYPGLSTGFSPIFTNREYGMRNGADLIREAFRISNWREMLKKKKKKKKKTAPILALCLWFGCMISSEQKWSFSFCSALCFAHYGLRSSLSSSQLAAAHSDCCMLVICKHTIVLLTGKLVMKLLHLVERCRTPAHKVQEVQSGKPKRQETERKWKLHVLRRHFFSMVTDLIRDPTAHTIRLIENHWRIAVAHESQLIREWVRGPDSPNLPNVNGPFPLQSDKTKSPDLNFTIGWLSYTVRSDIEERVAKERPAWKHNVLAFSS